MLTKQVEDLYDKNLKTLKNETEGDTRKWEVLPCSWVGRINIINMAILPKTIYSSVLCPAKLFRPQNNNTQLHM